MNYERLTLLNKEILACPFSKESNLPCGRSEGFLPVINELYPTQRYLIISSDPSRDTDKTRDTLQPHSHFEPRFLALLFVGSDSPEVCQAIREDYSELKKIFLKYFYWTHYCKCYSGGNPNRYCSTLYLEKEIKLFHPELIIAVGGKAAEFLLGSGKLINRVNKVAYYQNIPVICTLHPSQNWNRRRRDEFSFYQTWELIRGKINFNEEDSLKFERILRRVKKRTGRI